MIQELPKETLLRDDPRFRVTPVQQMVAACAGALITSVIMTPMDVVKIRLQTQQKMPPEKCFTYCNRLMYQICPSVNASETYWHRRPIKFNGTLDAIKKISHTEGITSLWSGLSPTLVLALPATVVYYVTYEQLRTRLNDKFGCSDFQPVWVPLVSGCIARLWSVTAVSPLELIKTKMQSEKLSYLKMYEELQKLLHNHGYKGLWKGLSPTFCRDVPFSGIYWVTYEYQKVKNPELKSSFWFFFLAGSISGTIAALITTPFDVIKTHQQIELEEEILIDPSQKSNKSIMTMMQHIYNQNGVKGLFAGLVPRLIKIAPACAIMVSTFEYGKMFFVNYNMLEHKHSLQ